ncbi:NUDIX domain-containing protein [Longispora albida]|uniref:NUDIX domain-containing protein n=1 Tax=Longispora albida TaxID=203523 RepID=UPI000364ECC3|nr:NUDIX hydrolase [Longispora albida]
MVLPAAEWYATLPTFLAFAGAVITDDAGRILLVRTTYRQHWNLPGGVLEAGEPPHAGCAREVREEVGLDLEPGRLLVVDWSAPAAGRQALFGFLFEAGPVAPGTPIRLQDGEIADYAFVPPGEALGRVSANMAARLRAVATAQETGTTVYLAR